MEISNEILKFPNWLNKTPSKVVIQKVPEIQRIYLRKSRITDFREFHIEFQNSYFVTQWSYWLSFYDKKSK